MTASKPEQLAVINTLRPQDRRDEYYIVAVELEPDRGLPKRWGWLGMSDGYPCYWAAGPNGCMRAAGAYRFSAPPAPQCGAFYRSWPTQSQRRYEALRAAATIVTVRPWAGAGREYPDRDWALLDDPCDLVAALWCGEPFGTGMTVDMARRRKRAVWNFWEEWTRWSR